MLAVCTWLCSLPPLCLYVMPSMYCESFEINNASLESITLSLIYILLLCTYTIIHTGQTTRYLQQRVVLLLLWSHSAVNLKMILWSLALNLVCPWNYEAHRCFISILIYLVFIVCCTYTFRIRTHVHRVRRTYVDSVEYFIAKQ